MITVRRHQEKGEEKKERKKKNRKRKERGERCSHLLKAKEVGADRAAERKKIILRSRLSLINILGTKVSLNILFVQCVSLMN